jgi:hypothetical protein
MPLQLVIGNKNYSSWSMRPWVLLRHFGLPFWRFVAIVIRARSVRAPWVRRPPRDDGLGSGRAAEYIRFFD